MTASMLIEGPLPDLPSASGVEILDAGAYVIGDDSPFLHQLDAGTVFAAGRRPKLDKPDLECMAALVRPADRFELLPVTDDDAGGSTAVAVHLVL